MEIETIYSRLPRAIQSPIRRYGVWIVVALLLMTLAVRAGLSGLQEAATFDEPVHLAAGYYSLHTWRFDLNLEHPPLIRQWAALPLCALNLRIPTGYDFSSLGQQFQYAHEFLYHNSQDADTVLSLGRTMMILLAMAFGLCVFQWGRRLYGSLAALLALALYVCDPNMLAYERLVTTDVAASLFIFLGVYRFWVLVQQPTVRNLLWTGLVCGLALAAKFSAFALLPILFVTAAVYVLSRPSVRFPLMVPGWRISLQPGYFRDGLLLFAMVALVFCIGFGVVVADYGGQWGTILPPPPPGTEHPQGAFYEVLTTVPVPAPSYFHGFLRVLALSMQGQPSFLMGQYSDTGWPQYFPIAFLIKTPLPLLVLLGLSLITIPLVRKRFWHAELFLLIPPLVYFLLSMSSRLNLGYRHILPVLPFLYVLIGGFGASLWRRHRLGGALLVLLVGWHVVAGLGIHPHYLAYFNELAGGPDNGYQYLVDSNLDWGQDLKGLGVYMERHGIKEVYLSYFGIADADYYGITYRYLPGFNYLEQRDYSPGDPLPTQGFVAISATNLQGVYLADPSLYAAFRQRRPTAKIGYSIFLYDLGNVVKLRP